MSAPEAPWEAVRDGFVRHVVRWVGDVAGAIAVPTAVGPIELLHCPPTSHKPYHVLVSCGMARHAMTLPEDEVEAAAYAELLLSLPVEWPIDGTSLRDARIAWPLRLLAQMAAFPEEHGTWLGVGHTVPNGNPPHPYVPGLDFSVALFGPPVTVFPEVRRFVRPEGRRQDVLALIPIFERELELKLEQGTPALLKRFDARGVNELLDVKRSSVAGVVFELLDERS